MTVKICSTVSKCSKMVPKCFKMIFAYKRYCDWRIIFKLCTMGDIVVQYYICPEVSKLLASYTRHLRQGFNTKTLKHICLIVYMYMLIWWCHQMETFSVLMALCEGNPPVTDGFPSQGPWHEALVISLIWVWINGWANPRDAGDLRHCHANYDVTVMNTLSAGDASVRRSIMSPGPPFTNMV